MSDKFKPPLNIKQMGNIDQDANINIYIEDYAYTYLQQYVKAGNYNERLAFLIGKLIKENNKNIILISGAVNTKYTQHFAYHKYLYFLHCQMYYIFQS